MLKKKQNTKDLKSEDELRQIYDKGLRTLDNLMKELLLSKTFQNIKETYNLLEEDMTNFKKVISTCIKILLRC